MLVVLGKICAKAQIMVHYLVSTFLRRRLQRKLGTIEQVLIDIRTALVSIFALEGDRVC